MVASHFVLPFAQSRSNLEAHWDGECLLPWEEKQGFLLQLMMKDATEEDIFDGMEDLSAQ